MPVHRVEPCPQPLQKQQLFQLKCVTSVNNNYDRFKLFHFSYCQMIDTFSSLWLIPPPPTPSLFLQDAGFHFLAVVFYLSASVDLAYITFAYGLNLPTFDILKIYRLDISAVVRKNAPKKTLRLFPEDFYHLTQSQLLLLPRELKKVIVWI